MDKEVMSAKTFREMLNLPPAGPTQVVSKVPRKKNKSKDKLALEKLIHRYAAAWGLTVVEEFIFHPTRKWRFDWYIPELRLGIEFNGLAMGHATNSRHQSNVGITGDCEKINQAQIQGFKVLQYTALGDQWEQFAEDIHAIIKAHDQLNSKKL